MALKRLNLNLDEDLIASIDDYASSMHVNRSAAISMLLSQYFLGQKTMATLGDLVEVYKEEQKTKSMIGNGDKC